MHCFLRLSDLSLFPLSSLSASKAEWPTEEEEKEEKEEEEAEPERRRREFHARCSRCRRYRRRRRRRRSAQFTVSDDADDARLAAQREQPSFLFWRACKAARVGENNGGGRFADFMDCVSLSFCLSSCISGKRFILVQAFSFTPEARQAILQLSNLIRATLSSSNE